MDSQSSAGACWPCSVGLQQRKPALSQLGSCPVSQKELPSMQVRTSSCALLGEPASGSEQGDMNLSRNERPVGSAEGTWQTHLSSPSPPVSGSPSCFLLFQSTLKPSQHTRLLSAWYALSSPPPSLCLSRYYDLPDPSLLHSSPTIQPSTCQLTRPIFQAGSKLWLKSGVPQKIPSSSVGRWGALKEQGLGGGPLRSPTSALRRACGAPSLSVPGFVLFCF